MKKNIILTACVATFLLSGISFSDTPNLQGQWAYQNDEYGQVFSLSISELNSELRFGYMFTYNEGKRINDGFGDGQDDWFILTEIGENCYTSLVTSDYAPDKEIEVLLCQRDGKIIWSKLEPSAISFTPNWAVFSPYNK